MPIQPIDLQVNFGQTPQISKQQVMTQQTEILRQDNATQVIQKESVKNSQEVPETKDISEGPEKIKDEEKKKGEQQKKRKEYRAKIEEKEHIDNEKVSDPTIGQKIDIIG